MYQVIYNRRLTQFDSKLKTYQRLQLWSYRSISFSNLCICRPFKLQRTSIHWCLLRCSVYEPLFQFIWVYRWNSPNFTGASILECHRKTCIIKWAIIYVTTKNNKIVQIIVIQIRKLLKIYLKTVLETNRSLL